MHPSFPQSDQTLHDIIKRGAPAKTLYFDGKYFSTPEEFEAAISMADKPCLLI